MGRQQRSALLLLLATSTVFSADEWAWSWACVKDACVKSANPIEPPTPATSLNECRLTCGQFGSLWPRPTGATRLRRELVSFHPSHVTAHAHGGPSELLRSAIDIFLAQLGRACAVHGCAETPDTWVDVTLEVTSQEDRLTWETDESYALSVTTQGSNVTVVVTSPTAFGARHGLETLGQLTTTGAGALLLVAHAHVVDQPEFAHRGLLLDTSRNFLPLSDIRRQVDGMAACKMNVLHWHATDSHSFPLAVPAVPQLARHGAYSSQETYAPAQIAELVGYARARGVRVMLELDAPAHAGQGWQWGEEAGLGALAVCVGREPWREFCIQPPCGQLDPTNPSVLRVLRSVYATLLPLFPRGELVHLGGDEVFLPCWNRTDHVVDWMRAHGLARDQPAFLRLWADFHAGVLALVDELVGDQETPAVIWSSHLTDPDVIEQYLNKSRHVVQTWVPAGDPLSSQLLELGFRVIVSTKDAWYLDRGWWGNTRYATWRVAYDNRVPRGALGGEAAMWGELVDGVALDAKVWPRTAAVAERLWTNPSEPSAQAESRLLAQRMRLALLGLRPEAVAPRWCVQNPGRCARR